MENSITIMESYDLNGTLYVSDRQNHRVQSFDQNGYISVPASMVRQH